jgi:hypothetical protein
VRFIGNSVVNDGLEDRPGYDAIRPSPVFGNAVSNVRAILPAGGIIARVFHVFRAR